MAWSIEKIREYQKEYRKNNREKFQKGSAKWRKKNYKKEQIVCLTTRYRKEILEIKGAKCSCESTENLELHHKTYYLKPTWNKEKTVKKLAKNIDVLCRTCHRKLHCKKKIAVKRFM